MTYKELANMVLDFAKLYSDDSDITIEHIIGLAKPYRAMLLDQKYNQSRTWKKPADENYQTLCLHLENITDTNGCDSPYMAKSIEKIPRTLDIGTVSVFSKNLSLYNISFTSMNKLKFAGSNRYTRNQICAAIFNEYLYLASGSPSVTYMEKIQLSGVFDDVEKATALEGNCNDSSSGQDNCDPLDNAFPLEEALLPQLLDYLLRQTIGAAYRPEDPQNNANDDLSSIHSFIRQHMKNEFDKTLNNQ